MELLLKIYNGGVVEKQINSIDSVRITNDVNGFGELEISLEIEDGFSKNKVIELYEVSGTDNLVFSGIVDDYEIGFNKMKLFCRDFKFLLKEKLVLNDKNYINKSISFIVNDLLADWNTETGENLILETALTDLLDLDLSVGDNLFSVINTICEKYGYFFTADNNKIIIKTLLGEDKSQISSANYLELIYNGFSPIVSNIGEPTVSLYKDLKNVIIGANNDGKIIKKDTTSISNYFACGEYKRFRDGDLNDLTTEYLNLKKNEIKIFKFNVFDFPGLGFGDKVKLSIENTNNYLDFSGTVIVNKIKIEYKNKTKIVDVEVSNSYATKNTITKVLEQINENILLLNL